MKPGAQLCCYLYPLSAERKSVNYPMALDRAQRHFKTVTARNLHFVVTLFVKEAISKEIPVSSVFSQGVKRPWRKAERSPPFTTTVKNEWSYTSIPPHSSMTSTTASPLLHMQIHLIFRYRICHSWYIKDCIRSEIWPEAIRRISVDWEDQGIFNDFASSVALT